MSISNKVPTIIGKVQGRKIAPEGTEDVHRSQWFPAEHPGTCEVPYILYPRSIATKENILIRKIWMSSHYLGNDFIPFEIAAVPNKYRLAQVLACGLKASNATYSQHWQGMYFDWTFNELIRKSLGKFNEMTHGERFVENAFATVVLLNTGYGGAFMDMLRLRRKPIPPSLLSLEQIDMGTFEHNMKCAVGAVLGGHIGVNVIRHSLSKELIEGINREGYESIREQVILPGMDEMGRISTIIQIGFKQQQHRQEFDPELMKLAAAKLIERKSERRNVDFSRNIPYRIMMLFFQSFKRELKRSGLHEIIKTEIIEGDSEKGKDTLARIRDRINEGITSAADEIIKAYDKNLKEGMVDIDFDAYSGMANLVVDLGKKVLKPREDAHKMVIVYIDLEKLKTAGAPVDMAEHTAGEAIQAGLNSIHLDGTTYIPEEEDLRFGAFCLTGPIHAAECLDDDEQLNRGWGQGFWDIVNPELARRNKMLALIAISAKSEQDALIAERQAMEQRKSVNDVFWYRTWNHQGGKKLDVRRWISYADVIHTVPIPGNDLPFEERLLPEHLPSDHPITKELKRKYG
jgi:hypothetical protein